MSNAFDSSGGQNEAATGADSGTGGTAKQEVAAMKEATTGGAKDIAHTAKDEAVAVAGAAKSQLKDLYAQSRSEVGDQAAQQQKRLATGLRTAGDELGSMARSSEGGGIATDLVQQLSTRLSGAAEWLSNREPADVLEEVKRFARRRPLVFIAGAAVAGILAGRLTRALAANHGDESSPVAATPPVTPVSNSLTPVAGTPAVIDAEPVTDSPLFDSTTRAAETTREVQDDRSNTI